MGLRTLLVLLLLAGGLFAVLYFTDQKPKQADVAERAVLDGRPLEGARRVRWQLKDRPPIAVGVTGQGPFRLVEPLDDDASPGFLKTIFDAWGSAQMRRTPLLDDAAGREQAGLVPPAATFAAEWADGTRIAIDVGSPGPLGTTRFLRRDGVIWEGGDGLLETLLVGLDDLREKRVFRNQASTTNELSVTQKGPTGKVETLHLKREGGEWRMLAPTKGRADDVVAMRFLTAVLALTVDSFLPGAVRFPEREADIAIAARGAYGDEDVRLWLDGGQIFGSLPGRKVAFGSGNLQYGQIFGNAVDELRSRMLLPIGNAYEKVLDLVVDPGQGRGDRIRIRRESGSTDWLLAQPVEFAADPTACVEAIQAINNLYVVEFVGAGDAQRPDASEPKFGLGPGRLAVTVVSDANQAAWTLWLGAEVTVGEQSLRYACRADETDNVVLVDKQQLTPLFRPWTAYCKRDVLTGVPLVGRVVVLPHAGDAIVFATADGHWTRQGDPQLRDEIGGFVNDVLRDLRGDRAVDMRRNAFGEPDRTIQLARADGVELVTLRLWDRGGDLPLIVQSGKGVEVGFEISPFVGKQLRELWQ